MRVLLVVMALLVTAGFVYFNQYQHDMMMEGVESDRSDPRLEATLNQLRAIDTLFVLVTDESQAALYEAVTENPGKTIHELGVSTEDRVHAIEVPSQDGQTTQTVPALIVFTREEAIWNEVSLRTDSPVFVLDRVRKFPDIDYILLDPPSGIGETVPDAMVLDPQEITTLFWRLK